MLVKDNLEASVIIINGNRKFQMQIMTFEQIREALPTAQ